MKTKLRITPVVMFITTALLFSCLSVSQPALTGPSLPDSWQPGMKLTMSYGGGMRYYSYKLEITDTGSFYSVNEEGIVSKYSLSITAKDLDELLECLRKNRFDRIETLRTGHMHDKGSEKIGLSWKGNYISAGENHMSVIAEKDRRNYNNVETYIMALVHRTKQKTITLPDGESE